MKNDIHPFPADGAPLERELPDLRMDAEQAEAISDALMSTPLSQAGILALFAAAVLTGCGAGPGATGGGDGGTDGGAGLDSGIGAGSDAGPPPCTGCAPDDGCLIVNVSRTSDVSGQPWIAFPTAADGVGTLFVLARAPSGGTNLARGTYANADMKPDTASYPVDLGCIRPGEVVLGAFLDDNENALPDAVGSVDYRDSCPERGPPAPTVIIASSITAIGSVQLNQSCD